MANKEIRISKPCLLGRNGLDWMFNNCDCPLNQSSAEPAIVRLGLVWGTQLL